jgi:hypothetical protein
VPEYAQYAIVYDLQWYVNRMLDRQIPYSFNPDEIDTFFDLLRLIFTHIDAGCILLSRLPMLTLRARITMLHALKGLTPRGLPFLVHRTAKDGRQLILHRYSGRAEECVRNTRRGSVKPLWEKRINLEFGGELLCVLHYMRFPLPPDGPMSFSGDGVDAPVLCGDKAFASTTAQDILDACGLTADAR